MRYKNTDTFFYNPKKCLTCSLANKPQVSLTWGLINSSCLQSCIRDLFQQRCSQNIVTVLNSWCVTKILIQFFYNPKKNCLTCSLANKPQVSLIWDLINPSCLQSCIRDMFQQCYSQNMVTVLNSWRVTKILI
jgi:hypothetical protein